MGDVVKREFAGRSKRLKFSSAQFGRASGEVGSKSNSRLREKMNKLIAES